MPLSDEQRAALRARFHVGNDTLDALWNEAYRLGMLRAAEVCEEHANTDSEYISSYHMERMSQAQADAAAIRAEAGEPTPGP